MKKDSMALSFLAVICLKKHLPVWRFQVNVNCSQAWSVRIYLLSCLGKNSHFSGCPPFVGDSWKIHIILYFFMWELGLCWALSCVYPFDKRNIIVSTPTIIWIMSDIRVWEVSDKSLEGRRSCGECANTSCVQERSPEVSVQLSGEIILCKGGSPF